MPSYTASLLAFTEPRHESTAVRFSYGLPYTWAPLVVVEPSPQEMLGEWDPSLNMEEYLYNSFGLAADPLNNN
jgi:hypothetical protein